MIWAVVVAAVLMIPVVTHAPWTGSDFVFAGVILFGATTSYEVIAHKMRTPGGRRMVGAVIAFMVLAIWAWAVS